jgi:hypothetical protein
MSDGTLDLRRTSLRNLPTYSTEPAGAVSVSGRNFAVNDHSVAARWGLSSAEYTAWISATSMALRVVRGLSRTHALAVSVGSGGLSCPPQTWKEMTPGELAGYLVSPAYQRGCDLYVLEGRSMHLQQVSTLTATISYDIPVAVRARATTLLRSAPEAVPQDWVGLTDPRTNPPSVDDWVGSGGLGGETGSESGAFEELFAPVASSNQAQRIRAHILVTSEYQAPWVEVRLRNCTSGNASACARTKCSENVTGNCSYPVAFPGSWDNSSHSTPFGPRALTWSSHEFSPGLVVAADTYRFNFMWNELTGSRFVPYDMTVQGAIGASDAEASVWTSDSVIVSLAPVPVRGRSVPLSLTAGTLVGSQCDVFSYDSPVLSHVNTALILRRTNCTHEPGGLGLCVQAGNSTTTDTNSTPLTHPTTGTNVTNVTNVTSGTTPCEGGAGLPDLVEAVGGDGAAGRIRGVGGGGGVQADVVTLRIAFNETYSEYVPRAGLYLMSFDI